MKVNKTIIIVLALAMASIATVLGVNLVERRISSQGKVKSINVEVYSDAACTQVLVVIDWGILEPSQVTVRTVFVKNTGNSAIDLSMIATNWIPSAAGGYISMSWDGGGAVLDVGSVLEVKITLSVSPSVQGVDRFTFDIVITGSG